MTEERPFSEFSGVAGRVLDEAISPLSFVSGLVLGVVLMGGVAVLSFAGATAAAVLFVQIVMGLALVRFALNGLQGEWGGTVFSGAGGGVPEVAVATARYLALSAIVIVPAMLIQPGPAMLGGPAGGAQAVLFALWFAASLLAPPVFLIMSVTVTSFAELVSPQVWRAQFAGRSRDLVALYVVYLGALAAVALASLPFLAIAFAMTPKLGVIVAGGVGCLLFGISVNLAGRLCGFFACGELGIWDDPAPVALTPPDSPSPVVDGGPADDAAQDGAAAESVATRVVAAEPEPREPAPLRTVAVSSVAVDRPAVAERPGRPEPVAGPDTTRMVMPAIDAPSHATDPCSTRVAAGPPSDGEERVATGGVPSDEPWPAPPPPAERRPPLLDGAQRVEAAMRRFNLEPAVAVGALQELNASFAPDPHVLAALGLCFYRGKNQEKGVTFANQALPMIGERGLVGLAAEIFKTMRAHLGRLNLDGDALLMIAGELARSDDLAGAARAYSAIIGTDPDEARAIKGLLQVAERLLEDTNRPDAAAKVYRYLLERCSSSPLVDFMRSGLEDAERAVAHVDA